MSDGPDEVALFDELSRKLRDAHRRVAALDVPADEKARTARHLVVISDASKHDLGRALTRLDAFVAGLPDGAAPS